MAVVCSWRDVAGMILTRILLNLYHERSLGGRVKPWG